MMEKKVLDAEKMKFEALQENQFLKTELLVERQRRQQFESEDPVIFSEKITKSINKA